MQSWQTRSLGLAAVLGVPLFAGTACGGGKVAIGEDDLNGGRGGTAGTGAAGSLGDAGSGGNGATGSAGTGSAGTGSAGTGSLGNGGAAGSGAAGAGGNGSGGVCGLPKVTGPCDALFPRWWFNSQTGQCEGFTYGGCQGNANNFESLAECMAVCAPNPGGPNAAPCMAQDARGEGGCRLLLGFKWDGQACVGIGGCSCVGLDCGRLASTLEACLSNYATCGNPGCANEQRALFDFISTNKSCAPAADCQTQTVGCGITEDDCTGAVYMNNRADLTAFGTLRNEYFQCSNGGRGCSGCLRLDSPADCIAGRCLRAGSLP